MNLCMPAPWRHVPWHVEHGWSAVRDANGDLVCTTSADDLARLIAVAPEMLAELQRLRPFIHAFSVGKWPEERANMMGNIDAIIAKATGG